MNVLNIQVICGLRTFYFTVRHLRPSQVFFQIFYRLFGRFFLRICKIRRIDAELVRSIKSWGSPLVCEPTLFERGSVSFLNEPGVVVSARDWNSPEKSKLWLYNLHYFSDLSSPASSRKRHLQEEYLRKWMQDNPRYEGNGWEPYTISIRLVYMLQWVSRYQNHWFELLESIKQQADALYVQVEHHILANHIFSNAKALVFAGVFFEGSSAKRWLHRGIRLLTRELNEQFLDDGGHFERTPTYHALLLWDLCDLYHLAERSSNPSLGVIKCDLADKIRKGFSWLEAMTHTDGAGVQFNDGAIGVAPTLLQIRDYVDKLRIDVRSKRDEAGSSLLLFKDTGFIRVCSIKSYVAWLNVGSVGPSYQPGHAHAETFSFECDLFDSRFIVNSGTSVYGTCSLRLYQRSTKAHSTVEVNSLNSSEVWGGFRIARRAQVTKLRYASDDNRFYVEASHCGYVRDSLSVVHSRTWLFEDKVISVKDSLVGEFELAVARYYLHPHVLPALRKDELVVNGRTVRFECTGGRVQLIESYWYPKFGVRVNSHCLEVTFLESVVELKFSWD